MLCPLCQFDNPATVSRCRSCGAALKTPATKATPDALTEGTLLAGTYAVESVLGQGGFGITYRCHDQMLDRPVAVKEFFPSGCRRQDADVSPSRGLSGADYQEARTQFLAEARTLARCRHAGIVSVYAAFEANQTAYMVMELLHGNSLGQLLTARGGRMNEAEAVRIIEHIGAALSFVHELDLLHRDIKPDNIMVCDDGRVMLIDFGTAREYIKDQAQGHTVVVTPGYAPLEQYAKQAKRGAFTDIYSLAATLYHLLTGQMPPAASDRAMGVVLRPVREQNPNVSHNVARGVESGLAMEIAKRPQSVSEFLKFLETPDEEELLAPESENLPQEKTDALGGSRPGPLNETRLTSSSDPLKARQQLLDGVLPDAASQTTDARVVVSPPVKLAPQRVSPLASNPPQAGPIPHNRGGTIVRDTDSMGSDAIQWWVIGGLLCFVGLLFLVNPKRDRSNSNSNGFNDSTSIRQPSTYYSPPFNRVPNTGLKARKEREALREWIALPSLSPVSVKSLPATKPPYTGDAKRVYSWSGAIKFSPDGKRLAYVDELNVLRVLALPDLRSVRSFDLDKDYKTGDIVFSTDNATIAIKQYETRPKNAPSVSDDLLAKRVTVLNLRTGKRVNTFTADKSTGDFQCRAILNDGQLLLKTTPVDDAKADFFLWNPKTGKRGAAPISNPSTSILSPADLGYEVISPDGKTLVTGDSKGQLKWLDLPAGKEKFKRITKMMETDYRYQFGTQNSYPRYGADAPLGVRGIDFSLDGSFLASRSDGEISVFDSKAKQIGSLPIGNSNAMEFSLSPDGEWLAARGALPYSPQGNLLWNVKSGQKIRLQAPFNKLLDWGFSQDGKQLYGIFADGANFQFVTWQTDATPVQPTGSTSVRASQSSPPLTYPKQLTFRSTEATQSPFAPVAQVGELLAVSTANSIEIRRQSGALVETLDTGTSAKVAIRSSPNETLLAVRKYDGKVQVWDANLGNLVVEINATKTARQKRIDSEYHQTNTHSLAFSSDNKYFAYTRSVDDEPVIELWGLDNKPRRLAFLARNEKVSALTFSPNDELLIYGDEKGTVRWYNLATRRTRTQTSIGQPILDILCAGKSLVAVTEKSSVVYQTPTTSNRSLQVMSRLEAPVIYGGDKSPLVRSAISLDGELFTAAQSDDTVQVFQLPKGSLLETLPKIDNDTSSLIDQLSFSASDEGEQFTIVGRQLARGRVFTQSWRR